MSDQQQPELLPMGVATVRKVRAQTRTWFAEHGAGGRWRRWIAGGLVWTVLAGSTLFVLRQFTADDPADVVHAVLDARLAADEREWPVAEARAAAARAAADAFTLDPDTQSDATPTIGGVSAQGTVRQTVETVTAGQVQILDADRATVRVAAHVLTLRTVAGEGFDTEPTETATRSWRWLAVPVEIVAGVPAVVGAPVEVAPDAAPDVDGHSGGDTDQQFTADTADLAEAIFAAWSGDSRTALDALTDGSVPLLASDVDLAAVERWEVATVERRSVNAGAPDVRVGFAEVTWIYADATEGRQRYEVHLSQTDGRWEAVHIGPAHRLADQ